MSPTNTPALHKEDRNDDDRVAEEDATTAVVEGGEVKGLRAPGPKA
ncbi:MAG: hypothetical protein ABI771_08345 [Betaproteobacteria bacterium]